MVQGGMSVVKFLVFVFNFVFVVCGIALIAVGVHVKTSGATYTEFLGSKFFTAPTIIITLGCIIFLIAFLGCWGALKQNYCMIMTFGVLLFLIFVIEIAAGIVAYVYKSELDDLVEKNMKKSLEETGQDKTSRTWDDMQRSLKCCGVMGPKDYVGIEAWYGNISRTCCKPEFEDTCSLTSTPKTELYEEGCYPKIKQTLKDKIAMVGAAGITIAVIEILGMIFAWCLAAAIKKEYEGV